MTPAHQTPKAESLNDLLRFERFADPDPAAGCHKYRLLVRTPAGWEKVLDLPFQKGPWKEKLPDGSERITIPNGVSSELLIALLVDHLEGFQKGPLACRENAVAITHLETALLWLQKRTAARAARGVEGTATP